MNLSCSPNWSRLCNSGDGYKAVYCPDHPNAWKSGYVYVHRLVIEQSLGRFLGRDEHVHHKDGNKQNNDFNNLQVLSNKEHTTLHGSKTKSKPLHLLCDFCGKAFLRKPNQRKEVKGTKKQFCSRSCGAKGNKNWKKSKKTRPYPPAHGERRSYLKGCRCCLCKEAQRSYMATYLLRKTARNSEARVQP